MLSCRAIGDSFVKVPAGYDFRDITAPQVVTSEPELAMAKLEHDDHFLILVCFDSCAEALVCSDSCAEALVCSDSCAFRHPMECGIE